MSNQRFVVDSAKAEIEDTDLADSQVTEPADELLPVKGICSHFHPAHEGHFLVHIHQQVLVDLDVERRGFGLVALKGVVMKSDGEWLGGGRSVPWLGAVGDRLDRTC
jgi:hypothetical protein